MNVYQNNKLQQLGNQYKLDILDGGDARVGPEWEARDLCPSFSRIYYILQGEGLLRLEQETVRLTPGSVYVIPAGLKFSHSCDNYMHQVYFHIHIFHKSGLDLLRGGGRIHCRKEEPEKLKKVQQLYHSQRPEDAFELLGILWTEIAAYAAENDICQQFNRPYSPLVEEVFYLAQNPVNVKNHPSTLADALHVSVSTLSKRFRQETGISIGAYLKQLVINRACYLLHTEESSVAQIARELGFEDPFYFAKYFKNLVAMSPSSYRKQIKQG